MFLDKFIKSKKNENRYRVYKVFSPRENTKTIKIVSKRRNLTVKQFDEIFNIIKSDLRSDVFNYEGLTKLEIQLLLNISNGDKIDLKQIKSGAIVIIH